MAKFIPIVYGFVRGYRIYVDAVPIAASVVFLNTGGKYVALDANGRLIVMVAGSASPYGWANTGALTASATAGVDTAQVDVSPLSIYRLPTDITPVQSNWGKTYDVSVTTNLQKLIIAAPTNNQLKAHDFDLTNKVADVSLAKVFTPAGP